MLRLNIFRKIDLRMIGTVFLLVSMGLLNLYSATHPIGSSSRSPLFTQQIIWITAGVLIFVIVSMLDYHFLMKVTYPAYILNVLLLIAVLVMGKKTMGAQRWLDLGFFNFQPSETFKIVLVLMLARLFHGNNIFKTAGLKGLIIPLAIVGVPFACILLQPDLGTTMLCTFVAFSMIAFMGIRLNTIGLIVFLILLSSYPAWKFGLKPYQQERVLTFIDPERDPKGTGYNSIQSKIAIGSGKVLGKGFNKGTQSQLKFLPERHTDFIFSVLAEEHGFLGSCIVIALFLALFLLGVNVVTTAADTYGILLGLGCLSIIFWHMFINIGMTTGLLPIVGIPLPFLSYGGSSYLTSMICLGIVNSIGIRRYMF